MKSGRRQVTHSWVTQFSRLGLVAGLTVGLALVLAACGGTELPKPTPPASTVEKAPSNPVVAPPAPQVNAPLVGTLAFTTPNPPSSQVGFKLEGCRNDGTPPIVLPNGAGKFICPDAAYGTGELGKGWNELDLVPHRLTTSAGNQANATTDYSVILAADNRLGTKIGYDVLSVPEVNTAKSDPSCSIDVDIQRIATGVTGGVDDVIYRFVNIHQSKGTTCVLDYFERLALGAAQYSGASLQSYMFERSDFKTGKRTVSILVKEIKPQTLSKDMTASQGGDKVWNLTKKPTPATVNFGDVCAPGAPQDQSVTISIDWKIVRVDPGAIAVVTNIYATNPAARIITVNVTDKIYEGTAQINLLDTATSGPKDVPANTANFLMLTHTANIATTTNQIGSFLNDVATATYTDKVTGIPVPGQTSAKAQAQITEGIITNALASITDSESITGTGLTFNVATPSVGGFTGGYVAGSFTTGPVGWEVTNQSTGGTVDFNKKIHLDSKVITSGKLSDTATLNGSDGFNAEAKASVDISSSASVSLTIKKTIPNVLQGDESASFTFQVKDSNNQVVATPTISFGPGDSSKSVTVNNLNPGDYAVSEDGATGWQPQSDQSVNIALPNCSGDVTFTNRLQPAVAKAKKVTVPAGNHSGWEMILTGPGAPAGGEKVNTDPDGNVSFATTLQEGSYTITETLKSGFDQTSATGDCSFTVNFPADAGKVYTCTFTNTQRGKIIVKKVTNPSPDPTDSLFDFTSNYGDPFSLKNGGSNDSGFLVPKDGYSVAETDPAPAGWDQTSVCDDGSPVSNISLKAGETVICTFTNTKRGHIIVDKVTVPSGDAQSFAFTTSGTGYNGFNLTDAAAPNDQELKPGKYSVSETAVSGWIQTSAVCDGGNTPGDINLQPGQTVKCTFTNTKKATVIVKKVMVGGTGTFSFSGTPSGSINADEGRIQASVAPGQYVSTEGSVTGWDLTSVACNDDNSVGSATAGTATFNAEAGETVTCTFTNTKRGSITIVKNTVGGNDTFGYTSDFGVTSLTTSGGTASQTVNNLTPGAYNISESTIPTGWDFTSLSCTAGGSVSGSSASITLPAGGNVTCTYTNTKRGKIIVIKNAKPAQGSFSFTTTGTDYTGFTLSGDPLIGNRNEQTLKPGTYTVKEGTQFGWILTGIGGSTDPNTPYNCTLTAQGAGGSTGVGDLNTQTATVKLNAGDTVTCVFENTGQGVTRTQGFWATHPQLADIAWFGGSAFGHTFPGVGSVLGDTSLCGRSIDTLGKLMGGFWSDISKTTNGTKRSALDQARMQLLQQLLAAELNASAFGSVPSGGVGMFATWEAAYCSTNTTNIKTAQQQAAAFNSAGDSGQFTPGTSANSKAARLGANYIFWDILP